MAELNAYQAAVLADDVYALTKLASLEQALTYLKSEYGDTFSFGTDNMLKGKTGGPGIIKVRTAFGFTLIGNGKMEGHAVILFRGTQYLADWLTNLNISVSSSSSGQPVHDGFNKSFKSMQGQLQSFIDAINKEHKIHTIHCIGHSLGGALATLCADWLASAYKKQPYLYSFGSPRVGLHTFASCCTRALGPNRIYRAYHKTDIVPCIPIWPYLHTPYNAKDYYLPSPGLVPMAEYHGMDHYINSVEGKSWTTLGNLRTEQKSEAGIIRWLKDSGPSPLGLTISSIEWLNQALVYVLNKCIQGASYTISKTFTSSFTLMDHLAYILSTGSAIVETTSVWVIYLMRRIMQVLGMKKVVEQADLSLVFIRTMLTKLRDKINAFTQSVLSKVMVEGRAV